jgi:hypothetical protein
LAVPFCKVLNVFSIILAKLYTICFERKTQKGLI